MIHDVEHLRTITLHVEHERAQEIREACKERAYTLAVGFAVAYKAGLIDGKQGGKDNLKKVYRDLAEARERINVLENTVANKERLLDLLANPEPDRDIEDIVREIDAAAEPTKTETTGDEKSLADIIAENDK